MRAPMVASVVSAVHQAGTAGFAKLLTLVTSGEPVTALPDYVQPPLTGSVRRQLGAVAWAGSSALRTSCRALAS